MVEEGWFGGLVEMPVEIGPHPSGIRSDKLNATRCDSVNLTHQAVAGEFHPDKWRHL